MLDIFEENLAQLGTQIMLQRKKYLEALQEQAERIYAGISAGKEQMQLLYHSTVNMEKEAAIKEQFLEALKKAEPKICKHFPQVSAPTEMILKLPSTASPQGNSAPKGNSAPQCLP